MLFHFLERLEVVASTTKIVTVDFHNFSRLLVFGLSNMLFLMGPSNLLSGTIMSVSSKCIGEINGSFV